MSRYNVAELAQTLFEGASDALFLFDPRTEQILDVNPTAQRLTGLTRRELLQLQITALFHADTSGHLQRLRKAFESTGAFHSREGFGLRRRTPGEFLPVSLSITRLHTGPETLGLITVRDVREQREAYEGTVVDTTSRESAEEHLLLQNQRLAALAEIGQTLTSLAEPAEILERIHQTVGRVLDNRNFFIAFHNEQEHLIEFGFYTIEGERIERPTRPFSNGLTEHVIRTKAPLLIQRRMGEAMMALGIGQHGRPAQCYLSVPMILGDRVLGVMTVQDYEHEGVYTPADATLMATFAAQAAIALENARLYAAMQAELAERRRTEEALRSSESRYRVLVDNLEQCVFLKDTESRFVAVNDRMCHVLARSEAEIVGKTDADFYPPALADKYRADDHQVLREGRRLEHEEDNLIAGEVRTVRVVKTPVRGGGDRITGVLGIFWDVTEQRALEAQLRQVQKMDAIGHLAGGIAHDFNNLLTGILGNLSLSLSSLPPHDSARELIVAAEKASLRAAELVRKLLGFSRRTMLRLETVNLNQSLAETLELLRPALHAGIEVKLHTASNLWDVHADPSQISQVLLNLCLNARDAMPEHGELTLRTENVQFSEEQARGQVQVRPGEFVCLRVADTGCGIAPETMPRIFEPFFTTKGPGKGTGLGLAMVFGIVEQHRGWIQCHSTVSEGTRFEVYLPRHLPPLPPPASMEGPCKPLRGSETILIVEDEALIRTLARTILERLGYRILMAEDGLRAVEVYEQEDTRIDLVLLDLTMPRMSGVETLDRLVEIDPDVCVVFSSGFSADLPPVSHHRQVHGFIGKPYRPDQLCASIRAALDRRKVDRSLHDGLRAARERQTDPAFS